MCNERRLKALGHDIRADGLLNSKPDAITPHAATWLLKNCAIYERAKTRNTHDTLARISDRPLGKSIFGQL